jgi:hypothetical protein
VQVMTQQDHTQCEQKQSCCLSRPAETAGAGWVVASNQQGRWISPLYMGTALRRIYMTLSCALTANTCAYSHFMHLLHFRKGHLKH